VSLAAAVAPRTGEIIKNGLSVFERGENLLQTRVKKTGTYCLLAKHSLVWEGVRVSGENQG